MSSFICDSKHFNSIEAAMHKIASENDFYPSRELGSICPAWYQSKPKEEVEKEITAIIDTLRSLNVLCVSLQYKHHYEGKLDEEIKKQMMLVKTKTRIKELTHHGLYNALGCLNYQIELQHLEGLRELTPEEKTAMKFMNLIRAEIAMHIVDKLPDDQSNRWSIQ